jgi:hypothetical protein
MPVSTTNKKLHEIVSDSSDMRGKRKYDCSEYIGLPRSSRFTRLAYELNSSLLYRSPDSPL